MASFQEVFDMVIGHEGYYANVKGDRGAETYKGISRKYWPLWEGWEIIDRYKKNKGRINHNEKIDSEELEDLVESFYFCNYWVKIKGNRINSKEIAANLFDMYINAGSVAIRLMQRAIRRFAIDIEVDGKIGPKTLEAINSIPAKRLNGKFNEHRRLYYLEIVSNDESQMKFLDGWLKRVEKFENIV
jgi:lysozyme family protein